eukprot:GILK01006411.1.p1 GENE.GILK01006411.1~~GILK01006411.1.p1  ORF type:complete len:375 (-),score=53.85 GILK01006411.1:23-1105(-)
MAAPVEMKFFDPQVLKLVATEGFGLHWCSQILRLIFERIDIATDRQFHSKFVDMNDFLQDLPQICKTFSGQQVRVDEQLNMEHLHQDAISFASRSLSPSSTMICSSCQRDLVNSASPNSRDSPLTTVSEDYDVLSGNELDRSDSPENGLSSTGTRIRTQRRTSTKVPIQVPLFTENDLKRMSSKRRSPRKLSHGGGIVKVLPLHQRHVSTEEVHVLKTPPPLRRRSSAPVIVRGFSDQSSHATLRHKVRHLDPTVMADELETAVKICEITAKLFLLLRKATQESTQLKSGSKMIQSVVNETRIRLQNAQLPSDFEISADFEEDLDVTANNGPLTKELKRLLAVLLIDNANLRIKIFSSSP